MSDLLAMGYNVNLDSLGTFSVSLQFEDDKATELRKVVSMSSSPITTQGNYTHKVWVKRG